MQNHFEPAIRQCALEEFLDIPDPPRPKLPAQTVSSRVLTSAENLKILEEKEKETREKAKLKEENARRREEKKREKAAIQEKSKLYFLW